MKSVEQIKFMRDNLDANLTNKKIKGKYISECEIGQLQALDWVLREEEPKKVWSNYVI